MLNQVAMQQRDGETALETVDHVLRGDSEQRTGRLYASGTPANVHKALVQMLDNEPGATFVILTLTSVAQRPKRPDVEFINL